MNTVCVECGKVKKTPPIYWVQVSRPQMVGGQWKCLFVYGVDKALCGPECAMNREIKRREHGQD